MKGIPLVIFIGILCFQLVACTGSVKQTFYHEKCDSLLSQMDSDIEKYINVVQDKDSMFKAMNLTTLRYQLQSSQYEIESMKVPREDSLFWVGALHLAGTYFNLSWEKLPSILFESGDTIHYQKVVHQMDSIEKDAIRFYLQYAEKLPVDMKAEWTKRLKSN